MPRKKYDEFSAGIFVILASAILFGVVLWVGSADLLSKNVGVATFYSDLTNGPQGIINDSPIVVGDLKIGKVNYISYDASNKRVIYSAVITQPGYAVYADAQARVVSGLLGGSSIMITDFGTRNSGPAGWNKPISISGGMSEIMNNFAVITENLKQLVVTNSENINELIDNMVSVSANLNAASKEIRRNPWKLLYKPDDKTLKYTNIYDAARSFDDAATRLNIVATKLKALEQLDSEDPQAKEKIKLMQEELQKTFEKFQGMEQVFWKEVE
ncbi:MAG TPA: hypothetical protein PKK48_05970 [Phycisphaerae bacterium]|nr:hypothetical protein [Phycisphaerae bacterium]HPS52846.1 hypothetical protein [Phycisphaerae bacterium]